MVGLVCSVCKVGAKGENHTPECRGRAKLLSPLSRNPRYWRYSMGSHFWLWKRERLGERGAGKGL